MIKLLAISSYRSNYNSVRPEGEMLISLHQSGLQVDIMAEAESPFSQRFREEGLRLIDRSIRKKIDLQAIQAIRKEIKEQAYDALYLFNSKTISNGILAAWGLPVKIITYRGAEGLRLTDPSAYLTHLHPRVDLITCNSEAVRQNARKALVRNKDKAVTIYKGQSPDWYRDIPPFQRYSLGIPSDARVLVCVANMRWVKGLRYLLQATRLLPQYENTHLILVGRGTEQAQLSKFIKSHPWKGRIHGMGIRKDAVSFIAGADIYTQPSLSEGLPRTVIEAMAKARPIVATTAGGTPELIEDGQSGTIVPTADAPALAKAIQYYLEHPAIAQAHGQAGLERLSLRFSHTTYVKEIEKAIRNLVER